MGTILNLVAMQIAWFACVLGAANRMPWLGVAVALVVVAAHLLLTNERARETKLIVAALLVGFTLDSALAGGGWIRFVSGSIVDGLTTPWMLGLWIGFATALTTSLNWLMSRPAFAILFGAVGGPAAYWSGAKLDAIVIDDPAMALAFIGTGWAAAMALFAWLVKRYSIVRAAEAFA